MLGTEGQMEAGSSIISSGPVSMLDFVFQREADRLDYLATVSKCMSKLEVGACWTLGMKEMLGRPLFSIVKGSARWTPVTKERLGKLVCRSQDGTDDSLVGYSEATAAFSPQRSSFTACCSTEPAARVS